MALSLSACMQQRRFRNATNHNQLASPAGKDSILLQRSLRFELKFARCPRLHHAGLLALGFPLQAAAPCHPPKAGGQHNPMCLGLGCCEHGSHMPAPPPSIDWNDAVQEIQSCLEVAWRILAYWTSSCSCCGWLRRRCGGAWAVVVNMDLLSLKVLQEKISPLTLYKVEAILAAIHAAEPLVSFRPGASFSDCKVALALLDDCIGLCLLLAARLREALCALQARGFVSDGFGSLLMAGALRIGGLQKASTRLTSDT